MLKTQGHGKKVLKEKRLSPLSVFVNKELNVLSFLFFFRMCETGLPSKATEMYLLAAELCEVCFKIMIDNCIHLMDTVGVFQQ